MATAEKRHAGGRPRKNTPTPYGLRLEAMMAEVGLSRTDIAERLGIEYPSVWAWIHTNSRPNREHTFKLARLLRRPAEDLQ